MVKKRQKNIAKTSGTFRKKLEGIIKQLIQKNFDDLDISPIHGLSNHFRCRVGTIRILYRIEGTEVIITKIDSRGDVYKGLN